MEKVYFPTKMRPLKRKNKRERERERRKDLPQIKGNVNSVNCPNKSLWFPFFFSETSFAFIIFEVHQIQ